jgi:SulP family sulfate permease
VLAALLFMQKMASTTSSQIFGGGEHPHLKEPLPRDIVLYEIAGPLFFGATENAVEAMSSITEDIRSVIFVLNAVPFMDVTGLVAFESAVKKLIERHRQIYLVGVRKQPSGILKRSNLFSGGNRVHFCKTLDEAVQECIAQRQHFENVRSIHGGRSRPF